MAKKSMNELAVDAVALGGAYKLTSSAKGLFRNLAVVVLLLTGQCFAAAEARAADAPTVTIGNFTFSPQVTTIKAGTIVTWVNHDDIPHTILDNNRKVFRSKVLDTDDKFSFTFAEPGTYEYFCGLHPHMTGQIVVTP